ncbi:hypothetical protein AUEXF2481DRAFT_27058 [Aureobasidium subglaciale EXF-2481]|uniref:Histidine kinase n=1 Tax=Aureobasidium subglaciale (strain EXF-2481) TaxID=1043005 RepID=A0A074YJ43_AURSE|nr:uncharacterized protein AUEXF2481DRAFT_27058 [Aureobasidium subglaciale EXF-2481]KAI5196054.1 hypothetical protein E4T38_08746 [Aureobasidium subglaciale]KAI5215425.1 hypothetical protein E4T40_08411 [Aureobasidium subglaciale]KAI5217991.1 hypothetical protein E4T41_08610 [Aureobasidium subglaciale]KAI5255648.1 hypothetical protein E4T46_08647 [Aureobasidium subglaciale]KEQ97695.1 hypothetical protein AUEXF2481DRAFT_27058 [Aureobasidium subglaciale EXF-2481]
MPIAGQIADTLDRPEHAFLTRSSGDQTIDADLQYLRELPWADTSIGPISTWSRELLVLINLAMLSPQPQLFLLGPDSIIIYNTAYGRLLYDHHPLYQGRPIALNEALISNAPAIDRIVDRATTRVRPANENHVTFFFSDSGRLRETFLSATMVKLPEPLQGFHATTYDTTAAALQLRRRESLKAILDSCALAKDMPGFWDSILQGIRIEDGDISFAMLYRADLLEKFDPEADCSRNVVDHQGFTLHGVVGSEDSGHSQHLNMSSPEPYVGCMREAVRTGQPLLVSVKDGTMPESWGRQSRQRCYGDDSLEAVIIPSSDSPESEVYAVLVLGIPPRRPYDEDYASWIYSIHQLFANAVTTFRLAEARSFDTQLVVRRAEALRTRQLLQAQLLMKQREAELQAEKLNEAIEAKRQQENFIDMTSHEIRNPLSAVILSADSVTQTLSQIQDLIKASVTKNASIDPHSLTELLDDIAESVDTISSCSMHQKRISDDILSLSKLNSGLVEISPSAFSLSSFMNRVCETFNNETSRADINFTAMQDSSVRLYNVDWIQADSGRIMQIMTNLISNAIKFTAGVKGEKSITIRVGASQTKDIAIFQDLIMTKPFQVIDDKTKASNEDIYLWFEVADTGCGMDGKERSKMFQRFSQASPKTYNEYGGSGLGLFISLKLVSLQGGVIGFTSQTGRGTNFAFSVRALREKSPDLASKQAMSILPDRGAVEANTLSVLLVEDNRTNQAVLSAQLRRHGYTVYTADNGQEAFDFLQSSRHWITSGQDSKLPHADVICMDIEMPIVDGIACTRMIRQAQQDGDITNHIPIIAVTANARLEQLHSVIEAGMDDAISKPFRVNDLKAVIDGVLRRA